MIDQSHKQQSAEFMQAIRATCEARGLPVPEINDVRLTERDGRVFAFAVFPQTFGYKIEAYEDKRFRSQVGSMLGGTRITYSNSTGFRLVALLSDNASFGEPRALSLAEQPSPLHVPIGDTLDGYPLWLSIVEMDSVLVGGSRRMGKTRLLHGWIQALQHGGKAQLYLWDGKPNSLEFGRYAGRANTVVIGEDDLLAGLREIQRVMRQRSDEFARSGAEDIAAYNARGGTMPPLVLVIDELAFVNNQLREAEDIMRALEDLIARGGAFGIYPVMATQRPTAGAVQGVSKTNLQTRISLPVPSWPDSKTILDRVGAEKMPKVQGRLLIVWDAQLIEAQSYLVDIPARPEVVRFFQADPDDDTPDPVREIIDLCLAENDGLFTLTWLCGKRGIGQGEARALQIKLAEAGLIEKDRTRNNSWCVADGL